MTDAPYLTVGTADEGKRRWEENAAFWVQIIREHRDRYRTELTDPAMQEAIGGCDGLVVLDAGCGEGYMAREIRHRGATQVVGVDKSEALIDAATTAAGGDAGLTFRTADIGALPFNDAIFDLVVANHVINDLEDITAAVHEFARVLKHGGRLVMLMLHPCFYGMRAEREAVRRNLSVNEYFSTRAIEQHFNVDGLVSPSPAVYWVRPLEDYTQALADAGFFITGLLEPHQSFKDVSDSAWWRDNFPRPLFLLITAMTH